MNDDCFRGGLWESLGGTFPLGCPQLTQPPAQRDPASAEPPFPGSPARAATRVAILATTQIACGAAFNFSAKERFSQRGGLGRTHQRLGML